jgi:2-iminoacetate synthase
LNLFLDLFEKIKFKDCITEIKEVSKSEVESTLHIISGNGKLNFKDYLALLSPNADIYLEDIANYSKKITLERFGKTILMYQPLYLSNECRSSCSYCGYSFENKIPRKTLSEIELVDESEILLKKGIRHILLLTGEDYSKTPISYISSAIKLLSKNFSSISIEIYPMEVEDYKLLIDSGADGLTLYQETYDEFRYKEVHTRGVKKDMKFRLNGPDRGGLAGFRKIGIGALLGLSDPLGEMYMLGLHAQHLIKSYWKSFIQVSLPRMRKAEGDFSKIIPVKDKEFVRFLFALRIYFRDIGLVLSTRETPFLRDNLIGLGITQMSAGSKTEPGGYQGMPTLRQFEIEDKRSLEEVVLQIQRKGFDPIFKDFDRAFYAST